jgi:hypothetical protein
MTSHSDANQPFGSNANEPNWEWLQSRLDSSRSEQFSTWIARQLAVLEDDFADMTTLRSRSRAARHKREWNQDHSPHPEQ